MELVVGVPGKAEGPGRRAAADDGAPHHPDPGEQEDQNEAENDEVDDLGAGRQFGALEKIAEQDLLERLGVDLDPGRDGIERRRPLVLEARRGGADEHDDPLDLLAGNLGFEDLPGGDETLGARRRVVHPHLATGIGRNDELADLDSVDARALAEAQHAAGARGLDLVTRLPSLGDAQCRERKRRIEVVAEPEHRRNTADDAIGVDRRIEAAVARRRGFDDGQVHHRARVFGLNGGQGIVPTIGKSLLQRRCADEIAPGQHEAGDDARLGDRVGQDLVVIGHLVGLLPQAPHRRRVGPQRQHPRRRGAVGLGEDHVEHDHRGAELGEPRDQLGDLRARPRPLADALQRRVVEVDDAHRRLPVRPGLKPLKAVENEQAQAAHDVGIGDPETRAPGKQGQGDQNRDPAFPAFHGTGL